MFSKRSKEERIEDLEFMMKRGNSKLVQTSRENVETLKSNHWKEVENE